MGPARHLAGRLQSAREPKQRPQDVCGERGKLFVDRAFGDGTDSSAITAAVVKADGALDIVIIFTSISQARQLAQIKGSDGRMRAITNRNVNTNDYSVRDGKFTANGNATPWQIRCR